MNGTIWGFPVWFVMAVITVIALPLSYRLIKKGIKVTVENKLVGKVEIDAEDDAPVKAVEPEPVVEIEKAEEK